jgi:hypothetical protein
MCGSARPVMEEEQGNTEAKLQGIFLIKYSFNN